MPKVVFLGGTFDLFHIGHLRLLKRAKKLGDRLVVGVMTDKAAIAWKRKPFIPYRQRVEMVREFADKVVPQENVDETYMMDDINPDIVVHGGDRPPFSAGWAKKHNKKVVIFTYTKEVSTTEIIKRIKNDKGK